MLSFENGVFILARAQNPTVSPSMMPLESAYQEQYTETRLPRWFKAQFAGRLARKEYLCLCQGELQPAPLHTLEPVPKDLERESHSREAKYSYHTLDLLLVQSSGLQVQQQRPLASSG